MGVSHGWRVVARTALALVMLAPAARADPGATPVAAGAAAAHRAALQAAQRLRLAPAWRADNLASDGAQSSARAVAAAPAAHAAIVPADTSGPPRPNVRANDRAPDAAGDGQVEPALARWHDDLVAAWIDGTGYHDGTLQVVGWAISTDGGTTWSDRGTLPLPAAYPGWKWSGSPSLAVNPTTGTFYLAALADASPALAAIGALKGRFDGSTFAWEAPVVARSASNALDGFDRPWIAVDPADGRVALVCTRVPSGLTEIDAQWADSALAAWSAPQRLSLPGEAGAVQGPRVVVGADGSVFAAWYAIGPVDADYLRIARSGDRGVSWSAPNDAVSLYADWGSGAPGYNLAMGIHYPALAVDRSGGAHDGRLLLAWSESLNWYDDEPGIGGAGTLAEAEPNDTPATATSATAGQVLAGALSTPDDYDWWAVPLNAGQTLLVEADTVDTGATLTLRLFATDGVTKLAYTTFSPADLVPGYAPPTWLFTAPDTGTYFVRVASVAGAGVYRIRTGLATRGSERGRDQRDAFSAYSDDGGLTWSTPVRVSTSPVGHDDWLPEVACGADGHAYCAWYDGRQAASGTCGGESAVWLARSDDGGATWTELGATSDARTSWSAVASNILPNQGTHLALLAGLEGLTVAWSDGRAGDPDIETAWWTSVETPTQVALVAADATRDRVHLRWFVDGAPGFSAKLWRRAHGADWRALARLWADGTGTLAFDDADVSAGATYDYRLGLGADGSGSFAGATTVTLPGAPRLALAGVWPNPARAEAQVTFTLAAGAPAHLALFDVAGRAAWTRDVGALGAGTHALALPTRALAPGVYLLTLAQQGHQASARIAVMR